MPRKRPSLSKPAHGGERQGAGRPAPHAPDGELTERTTVALYPSDKTALQALGVGNLGAGIRKALALLREHRLL